MADEVFDNERYVDFRKLTKHNRFFEEAAVSCSFSLGLASREGATTTRAHGHFSWLLSLILFLFPLSSASLASGPSSLLACSSQTDARNQDHAFHMEFRALLERRKRRKDLEYLPPEDLARLRSLFNVTDLMDMCQRSPQILWPVNWLQGYLRREFFGEWFWRGIVERTRRMETKLGITADAADPLGMGEAVARPKDAPSGEPPKTVLNSQLGIELPQVKGFLASHAKATAAVAAARSNAAAPSTAGTATASAAAAAGGGGGGGGAAPWAGPLGGSGKGLPSGEHPRPSAEEGDDGRASRVRFAPDVVGSGAEGAAPDARVAGLAGDLASPDTELDPAKLRAVTATILEGARRRDESASVGHELEAAGAGLPPAERPGGFEEIERRTKGRAAAVETLMGRKGVVRSRRGTYDDITAGANMDALFDDSGKGNVGDEDEDNEDNEDNEDEADARGLKGTKEGLGSAAGASTAALGSPGSFLRNPRMGSKSRIGASGTDLLLLDGSLPLAGSAGGAGAPGSARPGLGRSGSKRLTGANPLTGSGSGMAASVGGGLVSSAGVDSTAGPTLPRVRSANLDGMRAHMRQAGIPVAGAGAGAGASTSPTLSARGGVSSLPQSVGGLGLHPAHAASFSVPARRGVGGAAAASTSLTPLAEGVEPLAVRSPVDDAALTRPLRAVASSPSMRLPGSSAASSVSPTAPGGQPVSGAGGRRAAAMRRGAHNARSSPLSGGGSAALATAPRSPGLEAVAESPLAASGGALAASFRLEEAPPPPAGNRERLGSAGVGDLGTGGTYFSAPRARRVPSGAGAGMRA